MNMTFEGERPIFLELSDWIEDGILSAVFKEEQQIPSTNEISLQFKINPATALKGINILVDKGIIFKKRGVGMFVAKGACSIIKENRKNDFFDTFIDSMLSEAQKLGITKDEIIKMIERGYDR